MELSFARCRGSSFCFGGHVPQTTTAARAAEEARRLAREQVHRERMRARLLSRVHKEK